MLLQVSSRKSINKRYLPSNQSITFNVKDYCISRRAGNYRFSSKSGKDFNLPISLSKRLQVKFNEKEWTSLSTSLSKLPC